MRENSSEIKIAVADDHALFRMGVKRSLQKHSEIQIVAEVENGLELLETLKYIQPDIVLLDIQMPVMDGLTALPLIKQIHPNIKVIIISMHNDHSVISKMMEIGANSYLTKESGSEAIYETIKGVYENDFYFNELTNKALLNGLRTKRTTEYSMPIEVLLTDKEITILKLLCDEKSTKEIADIVDLSPRTVEAIRDKLKTKTGTKSMAGLVLYALKAGIVEQISEEKKDQIQYSLTNEQMAKLFGLSTSILSYINHDLAGQRNSISYALNLIKDEFTIDIKKVTESSSVIKINSLIKKGLGAVSTISSITNVIRSHYYWRESSDLLDFNKLFISRPTEIVDIIKQRYKEAKISISKDSSKSLEIIYPPQILLAILSELIENAKKAANVNLKVFLSWKIKDDSFQCEVHDNGIGFPNLKNNIKVSFESIQHNLNEKPGGIGLSIINHTILDSGGEISFSRSSHLNGAMIIFSIPIISHKKKESGKQNRSYSFSREEMAKIFSLSTSILAYINNDLSGQRKTIYTSLVQITEEVNQLEKNYPKAYNYRRINDITEKALDAVATINSITNVIQSHFNLFNPDNSPDFNKLFISRPVEIIEIVRERYKDALIEVLDSSKNYFEIIYPPQILLAILSELTENAKKAANGKIKLIIDWRIKGNLFQCEVHDDGSGFPNLKDEKFAPLEALELKPGEKTTRLGLGIINRTIIDSGGHLFFCHSKKLNGAMIYFEIPVIDFKTKTLINK